MPKNQTGFAPILILILVVIIAGAGFLAVKNIPFNQSIDLSKGFQGSSSAILKNNSPSPNSKQKVNATTAPNSKTTNNSSSSISSSSQQNSSNSNSTNNSAATPTPTPNPTATPSPTPTPSPNAQTSFSGGGITVDTSCSGSTLSAYIHGDIPASYDHSQGNWMTITDNNTNQTMIYEYDGNQGSSTIPVAANIPPTGAIRGSAISLAGDNRNFTVNAYQAAYTSGTPSLSNSVGSVTFHRSCP